MPDELKPATPEWIAGIYGNLANHPFHSQRDKELAVVREYALAYGRSVDEVDFDNAIADRFGDGCEYEWAAPPALTRAQRQARKKQGISA